MEALWTWINNASSVIGVVGALFSLLSYLYLRRQNQRLRELAAQQAPRVKNFREQIAYYDGIQTSTPLALAISLIPENESIRKQVQQFLSSRGWLDMPIEEINLQGLNTVEDREVFVNQLREKRRYCEAVGVTEIHLFFAGPVSAAMVTGAVLDNWIPVKLYHKAQPATVQFYEYWMPLI